MCQLSHRIAFGGLWWQAMVGNADRVVLSGTVRQVEGGRWLAECAHGEVEAADRVEACRRAFDAWWVHAGASRVYT